jgi:hypothetical protein
MSGQDTDRGTFLDRVIDDGQGQIRVVADPRGNAKPAADKRTDPAAS